MANAEPALPPPNVIGETQSDALGTLARGDYDATVITKIGNGPDCIVVSQSSVRDLPDYQDDYDGAHNVYLGVNCLA